MLCALFVGARLGIVSSRCIICLQRVRDANPRAVLTCVGCYRPELVLIPVISTHVDEEESIAKPTPVMQQQINKSNFLAAQEEDSESDEEDDFLTLRTC